MKRYLPLAVVVLTWIGCAEPTQPKTDPNRAKPVSGGRLLAGVAKVEVTNPKAFPSNDPLYVKALVLRNDATTAVLITVDAVAIGEIGPIRNDYLSKVRTTLQRDHGIAPEHVVVNASHCHGIVCDDVDVKTCDAVASALKNLQPVKVGTGSGSENRISENRRLRLKNGQEVDVRHAYAMPPDDEVAAVGPIDPQIGILRIDRLDGRVLAVVYNFACHPILGVPNGGNTADLTGFASRTIEENLDEGTVALFVQGCGGDINPTLYKEIHLPRDAEILGQRLGFSTLKAVRTIRTTETSRLTVLHEILQLPRADHTERIAALEAERNRLMKSLKGTTLNLKSFLQLAAKYNLAKEFPTYYSHHYLHEKLIGRDDLAKLDDDNRKNLTAYIENVLIMEQITRTQTNLALLKKHQERNLQTGRKPLEAELVGLRIGELALITFPGELTVEIGLNIKKSSPIPSTLVAGYTNGYIYYTPTARQLRNPGAAQEDCDTLVAPEWEAIFMRQVNNLLQKLR